LALFINKTLSSSSSVSLSLTQKDTLVYKDLSISLDNLRELFRESILISYKILTKDLLFDISSSQYSNITLEEFSKYEDLNNLEVNKCFRDFHPNSSYYNTFLYKEVFNNRKLRERFFVRNNNSLKVKKSEVNKYLNKIREFLIILILSIYLTSGLPSRGSELSILRFLNSNKAIREIFLDKSSLLFIIKLVYTKNQNLSERSSSSLRFLSPSLSRVFLLYIVLVNPFCRFLEVSLNSNISYSPFLFQINKRILSSSNISLKLISLSKSIIGQSFSIKNYRQIIVAIISFYFKEKLSSNSYTLDLEEDLKEKDYNTIISGQMNHSFLTKQLNYGRFNTTFKNIRGDSQFKYLQFCLNYFTFFNILEMDLEEGTNLNKSEENNISILYLNEELKRKKLEEESKINALAFSKKHSRAKSSISSSLEKDISLKKLKLKDLYSYSSLSILDSNLELILKEFLKDESASFKSKEQLASVKAVLSIIPFIIGILATNSGKSLSYLLMSSLSNSKISIIIIPLLGLKDDIKRRALEFNIPTSIYEEDNEFKNLTLISIETISCKFFLNKLRELYNNNQLDRIVLDEVHLVITHQNFRSIMFKVKQIINISKQFVFLTGSLPLYLEEALKEELLLENPLVIRGRTIRDNISYRRLFYSSNKRLEEIQELIKKFVLSFSDFKSKIILYCSSINEVKELSSFLNYPCYYSEQENKSLVLKEFKEVFNSYNQVLITSTALIEGFDYPSIRVVIIKDFSYSLIDFVQASGRSGRDNLPSISLLITSKGEGNSRENDSLECSKFRELIKEPICLRRVIDNYLDNSLVNECSYNQEKCSLCLEREKERVIVNSRLLNFNKMIEANKVKFIDQLKLINLNCFYHSIINKESSDHSTSDCPLYNNIEILARKVKDIFSKLEIILEKDSCCFKCLFPTIICSNIKGLENLNNTCFNSKLLYRFIAILYFKFDLFKSDLEIFKLSNLKVELNNRRTLVYFIKALVKKTRNSDLDTEEILLNKIFTKVLLNLNLK
jgi:superfamily II DNA helicase RecQ